MPYQPVLLNGTSFAAGLNFALMARVYLKAEVHFVSVQNPVKDGYERFVCSMAMAFEPWGVLTFILKGHRVHPGIQGAASGTM